MSKAKKELYKSPWPIIETHCHLDYLEDDMGEILKKSAEFGIDQIITISVDSKNINEVLKNSLSFSNVFCTQGIHPHHANEWNDEILKIIINNCSNNKVVAIGEVGLDYHYDHSPRDVQQEAFETQLQLAEDLSLPVVIHTRKAEDDTISILNNFKLTQGAVIHCYTSNITLAKYAVKRDFYLGFNGIITFKKATNVTEALLITPIDNIVLETDAPFLAPEPFRGKENRPYYLPFIAREMAKIKEIEETELLKKIYDNSVKLFKL